MVQQLSARQPRHKRILPKLSGEALMGSEEFGIDSKMLDRMTLEVGRLVGIGVQADLVIGSGNLFRGVVLSAAGVNRMTGDYMGILATVMNDLTMHGALERPDTPTLMISAISIVGVTGHYDHCKAMHHFGDGEVVISSVSTDNPLSTTDSAACLRTIEIDAGVILKTTKVDGVYTAGPLRDPSTEKFERLTYDEVLDRKLGVMDLTAICLCRSQNIPLRVFNMNKPGTLPDIVVGGAEDTLIEEG